MLLNNVHIIGRENNPLQIKITGSRISFVISSSMNSRNSQQEINFKDAIAFPGLINSHDHLEFNLYPKLGGKIYNDYVEWGNDIHQQNKEQIEKIQEIPYDLRFKWGLYKNLICGVTTVAHHGNGKTFTLSNMPDIISNYNYIHSVRLEKNWKLKLNLSINSNPFVVHLGEGKNCESFDEINKLLRWNLFGRRLIGVHGISLNEQQSNKLTALVWCPDSNIFLYNKTTDVTLLKKNTIILFGTDSTLSSDWNLWNQLRFAREFNFLDDKELFNSITMNPASVWGINAKDSIESNKVADIVICKRKFSNEWDSFYNINPEDILLILKNGEIVFIDKDLADDHNVVFDNKFDLITIKSVDKFISKGIKELENSINKFIPEYEFPFEIK